MYLFLYFATYSRELHLILPGSKSIIYGKKYMLIIYNLLLGRNKNLLTFPHICAILTPEFFRKSLRGHSAPFSRKHRPKYLQEFSQKLQEHYSRGISKCIRVKY